MRLLLTIFTTLLIIVSCERPVTHCAIQTELGTIRIKVLEDKAPGTAANFLKYVDAGLYDSTTIFRVCNPENESDREIQIEVIQGGDVEEDILFAPIDIETTKDTGLKHIDGVISMARAEPNSAQSSYFICIGDQPELDYNGKRNPDGYGFAAFGVVVQGMEIVRAIQSMKDSAQMLVDPVMVYGIDRVL